MGELDLDYIERLLVPEWQYDDNNGNTREREVPAEKIFSEDNQFRCYVCGKPLRMIRMINGYHFCQKHAKKYINKTVG